MCLGIPAKVIAIKKGQAQVKQGDHLHWLSLKTLDEEVKIGDYLLSYQDVATTKLTREEAEKILELIDAYG